MSDANDPNFGRGKKEDGWKTVVFQSPFAQGGQNPPPPAPGTPDPGQPQGSNYPPPQAPAPGYPSEAPSPSQSYGQPQAPYTPPAAPPPLPAASDKTQVYTPAQFASASQQAPSRSPQSAGGPPPNFPPPVSGVGPSTPPPPFGGSGNAPPSPPPGYQQQRVAPPPGQPFPQQYGAPPKKKSKVWIWVLAIIATLIVVFVVGCVGVLYYIGKSAVSSPKAAIVVLHTEMANGDLPALYNDADDAWKASLSRSASDLVFNEIHEKLGKPLTYTELAPPGEPNAQGLVEVKLNTTFDYGTANETIIFHKSDGKLKLYQYNLDSIHTAPITHERPLN